MRVSITYPPSSPPWGKIKGMSGEEDWLGGSEDRITKGPALARQVPWLT